MILDTLDRLPNYFSLHPGFAAAHATLAEMMASPPPDGRYEITGERLFVLVARDQGRGPARSPLEFHRRYIDIQLALAAHDLIGWQPLSACRQLSQSYDDTRDIGFFADHPLTWLHVAQGSFTIFYPTDAHAPLAAEGPVVKAVAKVAVDW